MTDSFGELAHLASASSSGFPPTRPPTRTLAVTTARTARLGHNLIKWFTETQLDYLEKAGPAAVADEVNEVLSESSESFGLLKYTPSNPPSAPGEMPPEPNDMRRVDFGCHPEDPLKVAEEWNEPIHCLICGSST